MAVFTVCKFNQFVYCRYQETCRNHHVNELCENEKCEMDTCTKRHPRICTYFQNYKRCKFGTYCAYRHIAREDFHSDVDELKKQINDLMIQVDILNLEKQMMEEKIKCFENKLSNIESTLVETRLQEVCTPGNATTTARSTPLNAAQLEGPPKISRRKDQLGTSLGAFPPWSYQTR